MSRHSKAKRELRRKHLPKRPIRRLGDALQPHAQLEDAQGHAVGGVGWRDDHWLIVLGGKVAARSDSAAMALAMLRHVAALRASAGQPVRLSASPVLLTAAEREAQAHGHGLEDHLAMLEHERATRGQDDEAPPTTH